MAFPAALMSRSSSWRRSVTTRSGPSGAVSNVKGERSSESARQRTSVRAKTVMAPLQRGYIKSFINLAHRFICSGTGIKKLIAYIEAMKTSDRNDNAISMEKTEKHFYEAPETEVFTVAREGVICASYNGFGDEEPM